MAIGYGISLFSPLIDSNQAQDSGLTPISWRPRKESSFGLVETSSTSHPATVSRCRDIIYRMPNQYIKIPCTMFNLALSSSQSLSSQKETEEAHKRLNALKPIKSSLKMLESGSCMYPVAISRNIQLRIFLEKSSRLRRFRHLAHAWR
ncbi:unnamed protein product [Citrullus colocynthis]|uniref:Uncharacterized protein n=1 Tax=Citrullus colocynthis TaxID=252529 RepID=A0ABP0Z3C4_9ROSI